MVAIRKSTIREVTAVILLDFQNEFAKEGGKLHDAVKDAMASTGMLEKVPKLIEVARNEGCFIIHAPFIIGEEADGEEAVGDDDLESPSEPSFDSSASKENNSDGLFINGTWNAQIIDEANPRTESESEVILHRQTKNCIFQGTKLIRTLQKNKIEKLIVCGFLSNISIDDFLRTCSDMLPNLKVVLCSDGCVTNTITQEVVTQEILQEISQEMKEEEQEEDHDYDVIDTRFSTSGCEILCPTEALPNQDCEMTSSSSIISSSGNHNIVINNKSVLFYATCNECDRLSCVEAEDFIRANNRLTSALNKATSWSKKTLPYVMCFIIGWANVVSYAEYDTYGTMMTGNLIGLGESIAYGNGLDVVFYIAVIISYCVGLSFYKMICDKVQQKKLNIKTKSAAVISPLLILLGILQDLWVYYGPPELKRYGALFISIALGIVVAIASKVDGIIVNLYTGHLAKINTGGYDFLFHREKFYSTTMVPAIQSFFVVVAFVCGAIFSTVLRLYVFKKGDDDDQKSLAFDISLLYFCFALLLIWYDDQAPDGQKLIRKVADELKGRIAKVSKRDVKKCQRHITRFDPGLVDEFNSELAGNPALIKMKSLFRVDDGEDSIIDDESEDESENSSDDDSAIPDPKLRNHRSSIITPRTHRSSLLTSDRNNRSSCTVTFR